MLLNTTITINNCSNKHSKVASKHNFLLMRVAQNSYAVYSLDYAFAKKHTQKDLDAVVKALQAI